MSEPTKIDVVIAREVFEENKKIILGAKCVRMNVWRDIVRYEQCLSRLEKERRGEPRSSHADPPIERRSSATILRINRDVSPPSA